MGGSISKDQQIENKVNIEEMLAKYSYDLGTEVMLIFEEEEEDPRWDLVRQLVEYKQFKDAAGFLETSALYQENVFDAGPAKVEIVDDEPGVSLKDVSLFDLIAAFNDVLKKAPVETFGEIEGDRFTVADKIDSLLALTRQKGSVKFVDLLIGLGSRNEVICCFLALLELLKLQQIY